MKKSYRIEIVTYLALLLLLSGMAPLAVQAQNDNSYFIANQLLQRQEYQRAYELFHELHRQNPSNYTFLEKATESLINIKEYDRAVELLSEAVQQPYYPDRASIRLGEIHHIRGDTAKAFEIWDRIKKENKGSLEIQLSLARTMRDRRAFDRAITTYKDAARMFSDASILSNELANTYMQAGKYENSIREYLKIIEENPDRISYVQSTLLRFDDDYVYDIAILEISDFLDELPSNHPSHRDLHQLELWLLLERELYERALATARNYEDSSSQTTYSLYSLGARLLSERQYELAEQAFRYYVENDVSGAKYQSMEELATVYTAWAEYLGDFNLSEAEQQKELYRKAFNTLQQLKEEAPNYRNLDRILISMAELSLDHFYDVGQAGRFLTELEERADSANLVYRKYIEGRILLYQQDYDRARIAFTKSNKQERIGDLAEKTRYYLALTDFFAGDYEFAKIQLNALERQSTSYYANDAVQLRVWIQDGLQADSTGEMLQPFAKAVEHFSRGENDRAIGELTSLIQQNSFHPLSDEALLEFSSHLTPHTAALAYDNISRYLNLAGRSSPLRERLMWEKARIADEVLSDKNLNFETGGDSDQNDNREKSHSTLYPGTVGDLISLYEDLLLEFPEGFYASYARSRIEELQQVET